MVKCIPETGTMFRNAARHIRQTPSNLQPLRTPPDKTRVQSVQRALQLLLLFTHEAPEWGVADLSRKLSLPKSIVFRLLATLQDEGFVEQNRENSKYRLGSKVFEIAAVYSSQNDLITVGKRYLNELVAEAGVGGLISVLDGATYMCLVSVPSRSLLDIHLRPGDRRPAHATAAGKVLLAGLEDDAVRQLYPDGKLEAITPRTLRDVDQLLHALEVVRKQGYAATCDESFMGLTAVAAPIRNYQGHVIAAIALGWVTNSLAESQTLPLAQLTMQAADAISNHLGDVPTPVSKAPRGA